jgi:hypothetical protein
MPYFYRFNLHPAIIILNPFFDLYLQKQSFDEKKQKLHTINLRLSRLVSIFAENRNAMRKYTRLLLLALFLVMMPAVNAAAAVVYESPQEVNDFEEVRITLNGANLRVQNGSGMSVEIYNITGVKVADYRIDSNDKTIRLELNRGCYIIKVGKTVRKISIL